jgi:hypothetical protein
MEYREAGGGDDDIYFPSIYSAFSSSHSICSASVRACNSCRC